MKTINILITTLLLSNISLFGELRKWTEETTDRVIVAKMIDKKMDDSETMLRLENGKEVWIKTDRFIENDRKYVEQWVKPVDHLSARVVASGKGFKTIEVTAIAGSKNLKIIGYDKVGGGEIEKNIKPGEEITFTYDANNKYEVKAWEGDVVVDHETWNKKTGL